jgi:hypothetical protein
VTLGIPNALRVIAGIGACNLLGVLLLQVVILKPWPEFGIIALSQT